MIPATLLLVPTGNRCPDGAPTMADPGMFGSGSRGRAHSPWGGGSGGYRGGGSIFGGAGATAVSSSDLGSSPWNPPDFSETLGADDDDASAAGAGRPGAGGVGSGHWHKGTQEVRAQCFRVRTKRSLLGEAGPCVNVGTTGDSCGAMAGLSCIMPCHFSLSFLLLAVRCEVGSGGNGRCHGAGARPQLRQRAGQGGQEGEGRG